MNRKLKKSRAIEYAILCYAVVLMLLVGPIGILDSSRVAAGNQTTAGQTEPVGQDDFLCVVFHEKIPFCGRMRGTFPLSIIRKPRKNATRRIPSILRTIWDCILPESPLS